MFKSDWKPNIGDGFKTKAEDVTDILLLWQWKTQLLAIYIWKKHHQYACGNTSHQWSGSQLSLSVDQLQLPRKPGLSVQILTRIQHLQYPIFISAPVHVNVRVSTVYVNTKSPYGTVITQQFHFHTTVHVRSYM